MMVMDVLFSFSKHIAADPALVGLSVEATSPSRVMDLQAVCDQ